MSYKHGIYGEIKASEEAISTSKSIPVYIGTAPMYRLDEDDRYINRPVLVKGYEDAIRKTGYATTDDFEKFTLSAAIYCHFENSIEPIGPIVIINVLDTKKAVNENIQVQMINGVGTIEKYVLADSVNIADKVKDEDYTLEYNSKGYLVIRSTDKGKLEDEITIACKTIDVNIEETDIIGTYDKDTEERKGIEAIENVYEDLNVVPTMLSTPFFNSKNIRAALLKKTKKISGKWEAIIVDDIDCQEAPTIEKAKKWKADNGYNSNEEKLLWPMGNVNGLDIPLSILYIVAKMQTDESNNDVPYQTASNKKIDIAGLKCNGISIKISQERANELNENGITTAIFNNGKYVLWGDHMANYEYGVTSKPEEIFDSNIIMEKYLLNDFQLRNAGTVDKAMSRSDIETLINSEQQILSSYVKAGELLYGNIKFNSSDNKTSDIINGDFVFRTLVTTTPIGKSITNYMQYTSAGINSVYGEENDE